MKRYLLRSILFGIVFVSAVIICDYDQIVLAQTITIPTNEGNITMSYTDPLTGRKMPDGTEKEAMKIGKSVVLNFFKALSDKNYRLAINYLGPEFQKSLSNDKMEKIFSNTISISLYYCNPIYFEGNLVIFEGRGEETKRTVDGKIDPRLLEYKFAVNKIGNEWKIVDMTEEDVTLKHL